MSREGEHEVRFVILRTVRKSCVEVVGDSMTELKVNFVEQELLFSVNIGHGNNSDGKRSKRGLSVGLREGGE